MPQDGVTDLIMQLEEGERDAFDRLLEQVYPDLKAIAHARLRDQRPDHTLNTTDLVHEAYLRLVRYQDVTWKGRAHFFGAVSQTMRRILVDHARANTAQKRSGGYVHVGLTQAEDVEDLSWDGLIELDDALTRLAEEHPRWVRVIECRYFAGLTIEETAEALGISHGTVSNDWRMSRAWLQRELGPDA